MTEPAVHFWEFLPPDKNPPERTIQVWQIDLADWRPHLDHLNRVLSADERRRADRYVFAKHAHRYTVVHGVLRWLLGGMLDVPPWAVRIVQPDQGKPHIVEADGRPSSLRFNLSDSGNVAMIAVARLREVGVDVEQIRPLRYLELAERFFAAEEARDLRSLPEEAVVDAFFSCWTRKEAYLKAIGTGLLTPLHSFAVSLRPDEPACLRCAPGRDQGKWALYDLDPGNGYAAALTAEGRRDRIVKATLIPANMGMESPDVWGTA